MLVVEVWHHSNLSARTTNYAHLWMNELMIYIKIKFLRWIDMQLIQIDDGDSKVTLFPSIIAYM